MGATFEPPRLTSSSARQLPLSPRHLSPASGQEGGVRSLKWSFDTVFLSSGELPRAATESISRVDAYYSSVFI